MMRNSLWGKLKNNRIIDNINEEKSLEFSIKEKLEKIKKLGIFEILENKKLIINNDFLNGFENIDDYREDKKNDSILNNDFIFDKNLKFEGNALYNIKVYQDIGRINFINIKKVFDDIKKGFFYELQANEDTINNNGNNISILKPIIYNNEIFTYISGGKTLIKLDDIYLESQDYSYLRIILDSSFSKVIQFKKNKIENIIKNYNLDTFINFDKLNKNIDYNLYYLGNDKFLFTLNNNDYYDQIDYISLQKDELLFKNTNKISLMYYKDKKNTIKVNFNNLFDNIMKPFSYNQIKRNIDDKISDLTNPINIVYYKYNELELNNLNFDIKNINELFELHNKILDKNFIDSVKKNFEIKKVLEQNKQNIEIEIKTIQEDIKKISKEIQNLDISNNIQYNMNLNKIYGDIKEKNDLIKKLNFESLDIINKDLENNINLIKENINTLDLLIKKYNEFAKFNINKLNDQEKTLFLRNFEFIKSQKQSFENKI